MFSWWIYFCDHPQKTISVKRATTQAASRTVGGRIADPVSDHQEISVAQKHGTSASVLFTLWHRCITKGLNQCSWESQHRSPFPLFIYFFAVKWELRWHPLEPHDCEHDLFFCPNKFVWPLSRPNDLRRILQPTVPRVQTSECICWILVRTNSLNREENQLADCIELNTATRSLVTCKRWKGGMLCCQNWYTHKLHPRRNRAHALLNPPLVNFCLRETLAHHFPEFLFIV